MELVVVFEEEWPLTRVESGSVGSGLDHGAERCFCDGTAAGGFAFLFLFCGEEEWWWLEQNRNSPSFSFLF